MGFLGGADIANFIADVEDVVGFERKGFANGFEMFGFAGEFGGGGDEVEVMADAVCFEENLDVLGGVGG